MLSLTSVSGVNGVALNGSGQSGASVSGAGDVNGDGLDDVLIGAFNAGAGGVAARAIPISQATPCLD